MEFSSTIILFLGIFLMSYHLITNKVSQSRLAIDHVTCLFFGFIYYVYLPILIMTTEFKRIFNPTYRFNNIGQKEAFEAVSNAQLQNFLIVFLGIIIVVIIADLMSQNKKYQPTRLGIPDLGVMKIFLFCISILLIPAIYNIIPSVLSKYDVTLWVRGSRGPFLSYLVILITMSSMYLINRGKLKLLNVFTIFAFGFTLLNVLTGNRGFFISLIVSIVVVMSHFNGGIKFRNLFFLFLIGFIFAGFVGGLRSNGPLISLDNVFSILFFQFSAEGGNVATSMLLYIGQNSANLFEFPSSFLSQFINTIPSFVFPSKFDYLILDPRVSYYLSSSHFYVMLMVNFGIVGCMIFMYFFTYILNIVKVKYRFVGIYPALCAHIPFMFFRDFDLTVVKFMLEFTFLYAIVILLFGNTLRKMLKSDSTKVSIE
jgi:hypothetical protein